MYLYLVTSEHPNGQVEQEIILDRHDLVGGDEIDHEERNPNGPNIQHHFKCLGKVPSP